MAKINVGQQIKIVGKKCGHRFAIGDIVTVTEVYTYGVRASKGRESWSLHEDEFVLQGRVKDGRVWQVGDKAITNGLNICGHGFTKGTVVTVKEVDSNGRVDYVKDANGNGYYVENEELDVYVAPKPKRNNGFVLGDVIYLKHMEMFIHLKAQSTLDTANEATAVRKATEDERRKHLGLPPVKKDDDRISINITVSRKALREAVAVLGKANTGYEVFSKLDDIAEEAN